MHHGGGIIIFYSESRQRTHIYIHKSDVLTLIKSFALLRAFILGIHISATLYRYMLNSLPDNNK